MDTAQKLLDILDVDNWHAMANRMNRNQMRDVICNFAANNGLKIRKDDDKNPQRPHRPQKSTPPEIIQTTVFQPDTPIAAEAATDVEG